MGDLHGAAQPQRRRMTAAEVAESPVLKLLQPAILGILIPVIGWGGGKVLDRMDRIELALNASNSIAATNELRLRSVESASAQREADARVVAEKVNQLNIQVQLLDAKGKANGR